MKTRTKRRPKLQLGKAKVVRVDRNTDNGNVVTSVQLNNRIDSSSGLQKTKSEGHPWNRKERPPGDLGGNFWTWRVSNLTKKGGYHSWRESFTGPAWIKTTIDYNLNCYAINPEAVTSPPDLSSNAIALGSKGTTAIARCSPTNSVADLSVFLGETMKDRLPSIPFLRSLEKRASLAFHAGDEFLNAVFGWAPLVADIKKSATAIQHAQKVIHQFERDAGKQVRRRFTFDTEHSVESTLLGTGIEAWYGSTSSGPASTYMGQGPLFRTREITRSQWFSGAFTYHLPEGYLGLGDVVGKADKLFGLELTPSVLWELAPWSWAIDWVTNIGDGISNLSNWSQFGQVLRYGYIMETTSVRDTYTLVTNGPGGQFVHEPVVIDTTVKQRQKANPFGFGVTWEGLNPLQLAIAGALGLTKG